MKSLIKTLLIILCVVVAIGCMFYPRVYQFFWNDSLTEMQVFKQFWWLYCVGCAVAGLTIFLVDFEKEKD